jgi:pilus assembly protein CpaB
VFASLGVLFALAAFLLVRGYAERARAIGSAIGNPVPVVVAADAIPRGTVLDPSMFRSTSVPAGYAPPGAMPHPADAAGRVLLAPLAAGEPLTITRLAPEGAGPIAALVPPGLRAVQIVTSLAPGSVRAGDRVDVLATFAGTSAHSETVASELEVLRVIRGAAGTTGPDLGGTESPSSGGDALILLVSPPVAEALAFAKAFADLSVAVAGPDQEVTPAAAS